MRWSYAVLAIAFAAYGEASLLRGRTQELEQSGDWAALAEAEAEDQSFLLHQIDQMESQLVELQHYLEAVGRKPVMAGLQISAAPVNKTAKAAVKSVAKTSEPKKETKVAAKKEDEDPAKMLASMHIPNLGKGLMGKAALAPMLAMLKGMYTDTKQRIAEQNTREDKSKKWFTSKEAEHKQKLESIEAKFKAHKLNEEFHTNETRDENRYFNYWERCRQRQHRGFHTNLKIQHAMMTKVKKMIDMYEKALSPKAADQATAKKEVAQMTGMPEIVFLQRSVSDFCHESLVEVRKERSELQQWATEGVAF
jgi:hypothetical protein